MTEEKLAPRVKTASKRRIIGLFLAALGILVAVLWLVRQPIAEAIARGVCNDQTLSCQLSISRLDFGGITLTNVEARGPESQSAAVIAKELVVDLAWDGPFSPRPSLVRGVGVVMRLDLTGRRPLLGDLDTAIANFTKPSDAPPAPMPRLEFSDIVIIGETLSGPVEARGKITQTDKGAMLIEASAPAASLGLDGATLSLAGAQLSAVVDGARLSAALKVDLSRFEAADTVLADVKVDATLEQDAGVLKGAGSATLGAVATKDTQLRDAQANGSIEAAAIDAGEFNLAQWLANVRKLELTASTGAGGATGATWKTSNLSVLVQPKAGGGSSGEVSFEAEDVRTPQAVAGKLQLAGAVTISNGAFGVAKGTASALSVTLTSPQRAAVTGLVGDALAPALPSFANAARGVIDRAAQAFDISAPWTANAADAMIFALTGEVRIKAASGLLVSATPRGGQPEIASYSTADGGTWNAAGQLKMSGGGAPNLRMDIAGAQGSGKAMTLEGAVVLSPWKVGSDSLALDLTGLKFASEGVTGSAAGAVVVTLDGALAGGLWKGARATARVDATWTGDSFVARAPGGATIQWSEARYGDTTLGAAAIRYTPQGVLAQNSRDGLIGRGAFGKVSVPVKAEGFAATTVIGAIGVNWRAASGFRANFDMEPSEVDLKLEQQELTVAIDDIQGEVDLRSGWKIVGALNGGKVTSNATVLSGLTGKFDLAGQGDRLSGSLSEVETRIADPLQDGGKRYEDARFTGGATLAAGVVDFTGRVAMVETGVQVAQITGRHNLNDNSGTLSFDRTPLIFARRSFQPYHLSPLLIGPADVSGRVDVSGAASWSEGVLKASATLDLRKVGFVLASAGIFEGVSGHIEVADLLTLTSAPGQKITLDKVTLGMPIEKGTITFQLIGFEAIRLQGAEWPFVDGFIRVKPIDFNFSSTAVNQIEAQAVGWNLDTLVKQFKVPDLKLQGIVNGEFPVTFSAGSAEIDNAVLASSGPGVIQYVSSATDAAAANEPTTGMVMDALKDFRFEVLKIGLDGNLAGKMVLSLDMLGRNPAVLNGKAFQMNISIDSELAKLVNSLSQGTSVRDALGQTTVVTPSGAP